VCSSDLVDPRPYAAGSLVDTLAAWPHLTEVLPAIGYSAEQLADLAATIAAVPCDLVLVATPIDLSRLIDIPQPHVRVTYAVEDVGDATFAQALDAFLDRCGACAPGEPG
jgi:predicted GTPase